MAYPSTCFMRCSCRSFGVVFMGDAHPEGSCVGGYCRGVRIAFACRKPCNTKKSCCINKGGCEVVRFGSGRGISCHGIMGTGSVHGWVWLWE